MATGSSMTDEMIPSHPEASGAAPDANERNSSLEPNVGSSDSSQIGTQFPALINDIDSIFNENFNRDIDVALYNPSKNKQAATENNTEALATTDTVDTPAAPVTQSLVVPESVKAPVPAVSPTSKTRPKFGPGSGRGRKKKTDEIDELVVEEGDEEMLKLFPNAFGPTVLKPLPKKS